MTERRKRALFIGGFLLAGAAAGVLGGLLEEQTGQVWLRSLLLMAVVVPAVLVLAPMYTAKFAAAVDGDHKWYASSLRSTKSRMAWMGGVLALEADAVTFTPHLHIGRSRRYPLESVASVTGFADRPPRVRFDFRHGEPVAFSIFPTARSTIRTQDTSARDEAVRAITSRLSR